MSRGIFDGIGALREQGSEVLCAALLSGEFGVLQRCSRALQSSLYCYLSLLLGAVCVVLWLQLPGMGAASLSALVNGSGLLLLSVLLGQGLALLPRSLWTHSDPSDQLRALSFAFASLDTEHRTRARSLRDCLQHIAASVREAPLPPSASVQGERATLLELAAYAEEHATMAAETAVSLSARLCGVWPALAVAPSHASLVRQHRRLKLALVAERSAWRRRERVLARALRLRTALLATEPGFGGQAVPARRGLWLGVLRQACMQLGAVGLGLLSGAQLWGETACGLSLGLAPAASCHVGLPPVRYILLAHACAATGFALLTSRLYQRMPLHWPPSTDGRAVLQARGTPAPPVRPPAPPYARPLSTSLATLRAPAQAHHPAPKSVPSPPPQPAHRATPSGLCVAASAVASSRQARPRLERPDPD